MLTKLKIIYPFPNWLFPLAGTNKNSLEPWLELCLLSVWLSIISGSWWGCVSRAVCLCLSVVFWHYVHVCLLMCLSLYLTWFFVCTQAVKTTIIVCYYLCKYICSTFIKHKTYCGITEQTSLLWPKSVCPVLSPPPFFLASSKYWFTRRFKLNRNEKKDYQPRGKKIH